MSVSEIDRVTHPPRKKCEHHDDFCQNLVEGSSKEFPTLCNECIIEVLYSRMALEELKKERYRMTMSIEDERKAEMTLLALAEDLAPQDLQDFLAYYEISDAEYDRLKNKYNHLLTRYRKEKENQSNA